MAATKTWREVANMMIQPEGVFNKDNAHFLLALHSSSETLGLGLMDLREPFDCIKTATFPVGRKLSNCLLSCVNELLPFDQWSQIARLSVATGPGGFTGTRLTIVMARTLAQQLSCNLDGLSTFSLVAMRLAVDFDIENYRNPFWIVQPLKRGIVAGKYQISSFMNSGGRRNILELATPKLFTSDANLSPSVLAEVDAGIDVENLLVYSFEAHQLGTVSNWNEVLPIYPTSPVME